MRRLIYMVMALASIQAHAQVHRTEFVSFDMREHAERDDRSASQHYTVLKDDGTLNVPVLWLDRQIFLHVEGTQKGAIMVNNHEAGQKTTTPEEFDITPWITDGANTIALPEGARAWVHSQPKLRVENFIVDAGLDSLGKHGVLKLKVVVANGYNFAETLNVGYDIYSPQGKLLHFDARDVTVPGRGRDTLLFEQPIYGMPANLWTAEKPNLHRCMIVVRREKRYTEYIPFKVGFGRTTFENDALMRTGKPLVLKTLAYNTEAGGMAPSASRAAVKTALGKFKKQGFNTLFVDRPQPYWFYNMADEVGFYVIDQPPTGTNANDPRLLPFYMNAAQGAFARSRNHASVAGWSLGAPHGNGYNLQKTYLWFKSQDDSRPIIYNGAQGEWNSDMTIQAIRPR